MEIRPAKMEDVSGIGALLYQILDVHHQGRPDLFFGGVKKYTDEEVRSFLGDKTRPIFVAVEEDRVVGYAFCIVQEEKKSPILTPIKTLYLDDLCVDETMRGAGIGTVLFDYVRNFAKESGCYNLTLNVWNCNEKALRFYEKCGMKVQKIGMETIL